MEFSFASILFTCVLLFVSRVVYRFLLKPWWMVYQYSRKGFRTVYAPLVGELGQYPSYAVKYNDCHYPLKKALNEDPTFIGTASPLGDRCLVNLANPAHIKLMIQKDNEYLIKYQDFIWPWQAYVNPYSLTWTQGDLHKKKIRKALSKNFHFEFLKRNISTISNVAIEGCDLLEQKGLQRIEVLEEIGSIMGEVIGRTFFGFDHRSVKFRDQKLTDAVFELESQCAILSQTFSYQLLGPMFVKLGILPKHRHLVGHCKEFREMCMKFVTERKALITADRSKVNLAYLVDSLLTDQIDNEKDSLTDSQILDQYIVFFLAGQQTASHLITMILYTLVKNPKYIDKIRAEIKEGLDLKNLDYDSINKLEMLQCVLEESFRMYTPLQMVFYREAAKTFTLGDLKIDKGTLVNMYLGYAAWSKNYFKDPEQFIPERWLQETPENKIKDPFALLAFYAGQRNCIGQHLARMKIKILLIHLISRYNFKLSDPDYVLRMTQTLSYGPLDPIRMDFIKI